MVRVPILAQNPSTRILLVEDNDANRQLLSDYLSYCGYHLLSLPSGTDFFNAIAQFQPHLILLDLKLPEVDGYALLEQLKKTPHGFNIPVIVVSAFAFQADQQRAFNLGAQRYFVKPLSLTHLRQAIQEEVYLLAPHLSCD